MTTANIRLTILLAIFLCLHAIILAEGASFDNRMHGAKYGNIPVNTHYLSPGGEVMLSVDRLSLPEERVMTLTFDDGPDERDLAIAALLEKYNFPATFFYIGNKVKAMSAIVKEIKAKNYEIGYHSYAHQFLGWVSVTRLMDDFNQGKAVMNSLGVPLTWFRPPYGQFNHKVIHAAKEQGMETILWTIDSRDWTGINASLIAKNVIRQFHPGAVLLFHSNHAATLQALPTVLEMAIKDNYRFVSLREWRQTIFTANCRTLGGTSCSSPPPPSITIAASPMASPEGEKSVMATPSSTTVEKVLPSVDDKAMLMDHQNTTKNFFPVISPDVPSWVAASFAPILTPLATLELKENNPQQMP